MTFVFKKGFQVQKESVYKNLDLNSPTKWGNKSKRITPSNSRHEKLCKSQQDLLPAVNKKEFEWSPAKECQPFPECHGGRVW